MNRKRRRAAHYGKERSEESGGRAVFIQTLCCAVIIFYVLFGGSHNMPMGETAVSFTKETVSRNTDIGRWIKKLNAVVEEKIGTPEIPTEKTAGEFNESDGQKES